MRKRRGRNLSVFKGIYISLSLKQNVNTEVIRLLLSFTVTSTTAQIIGTCFQFTQGSWSNSTKYTILIQNTISDIHEVYIDDGWNRNFGMGWNGLRYIVVSSLVKLFLVDFHRVSLRENFVTYFTLERSLLRVTTPMHIPLGCSPEALATLEAREGLGSTVHPLMDCLLASLSKTLRAESTLEWLWVPMHATVPLKTAPTTQNLLW